MMTSLSKRLLLETHNAAHVNGGEGLITRDDPRLAVVSEEKNK